MDNLRLSQDSAEQGLGVSASVCHWEHNRLCEEFEKTFDKVREGLSDAFIFIFEIDESHVRGRLVIHPEMQ